MKLYDLLDLFLMLTNVPYVFMRHDCVATCIGFCVLTLSTLYFYLEFPSLQLAHKMLSTLVCRNATIVLTGRTLLNRSALYSRSNVLPGPQLRNMANEARNSMARRAARKQTLKEMAMAPTGEGGEFYMISLLYYCYYDIVNAYGCHLL